MSDPNCFDQPALALLAHDLRSPLTVLRTNLVFLANPDDENDRQALLLACNEAARRIERTVENLALLTSDQAPPLEPASTQAGAPRLAANLGALLGEMAADLAPVFRTREQALRLELPTDPVRVPLDLPLARMLLSNALINAAEQSRMGSTIVCRLTEDDGRCTLVVEDDGPSIPTELVQRLFELGAAAELTGQKVRVGKGLSLVALQRVARSVDGEATLGQPDATQRRRIVVVLPTVAASTHPARDPNDDGPSRFSPPRR